MAEMAESWKDIKEVTKKIILNTGFSVKGSNNGCLEIIINQCKLQFILQS